MLPWAMLLWGKKIRKQIKSIYEGNKITCFSASVNGSSLCSAFTDQHFRFFVQFILMHHHISRVQVPSRKYHWILSVNSVKCRHYGAGIGILFCQNDSRSSRRSVRTTGRLMTMNFWNEEYERGKPTPRLDDWRCRENRRSTDENWSADYDPYTQWIAHYENITAVKTNRIPFQKPKSAWVSLLVRFSFVSD